MQELIHLISGPRNISTALMYSFAERNDTLVVDEPFYSVYLSKNTVEHPGKEEIISSQSTDPLQVIEQLEEQKNKPYFFVKNMAHHLQGFNYDFIFRHRNLFLIRDPKKIIYSFGKVMPHMTAEDIGIIHEHFLFEQIVKNSKKPAVILDSEELLKDPKNVLKKTCEALEIPFSSSMLSWEEGPRPEDGIWAKYWYSNVHKTIGFGTQNPKERILTEEQWAIYEAVYPSYQYLYEKSIKA